uniref:CHK kinase-like domain-containing protein n=1 Tax=Panagrolaimus sp. ES5 TaxID=591445 RepID=A0AC34FY00_9BILA
MIEDIVDGKEPIGGSSFTFEWLLKSLRENDKEFQKSHGSRSVKEISAADISKGKGFASKIYKCVLTFVDSKDASDVYTTILKVPGFESYQETHKASGGEKYWENDSAIKSLIGVHNVECEFYENVAKLLDAPIPKVYKTQTWEPENHEGCIHMEDLSLKGKTQLYFENVNLTIVKSVIRELAHIHKNILSVNPNLWQGKYLKNQMLMANTAKKTWPMIEPFLQKSRRESEIRPLIEKYQKFAESEEFYGYVFTESYKSFKPVIVHGDFHFGNIMYKIDKHGDVQNEVAAIVDWQIIHEGSPMADLARFLTFSADGGVRRQAEVFAIDYYLECLIKEFEGDASKVPYTAEELQKAYKLAFLTQVFVLPGVALFFLTAMEEKNENLKNAFFDQGVLKALHGLEDADKLLQGELKEYFEKYGI